MPPQPEKKDFTCWAHDELARDQKSMLGDIGYVKGKIDSVEDSITASRRESIKQFRVLRAATNGNHKEAAELEEESTQEIELPASSKDKKLAAAVKGLERKYWIAIGGAGAVLWLLFNLKDFVESVKFLLGM